MDLRPDHGHRGASLRRLPRRKFGIFATPERNVVFDINDFDETLSAPWEWDVKRLAASIHVAARASGTSERRAREAVRAAAAYAYRRAWRSVRS